MNNKNNHGLVGEHFHGHYIVNAIYHNINCSY